MLETVGHPSLDALTDAAVPRNIRLSRPLALEAPQGEHELLSGFRAMAAKNEVWRSFIGMGYSGCIVPPVIQRNILENPGWYTQYTPYQAEISQGRLEALLNFQTMVGDLTGLAVANASLLDEATAAAEAMALCLAVNKRSKARRFFVSERCHPQTIEVVRGRALPLDIEVVVGDETALDFTPPLFGLLLSYPATDGSIRDYRALVERAHREGALVAVATDLLALALLEPPGAWGADVAVGNSQRFGVPLGYGGPHAAFMATRDEFKRDLPGRIVGVSKDKRGTPAMRLALQTREQHIRREKATSNICTAQVLLAVMSSMYAVYHGPKGIRAIAERVHGLALAFDAALRRRAYRLPEATIFDTVRVDTDATQREAILRRCRARRINLRTLPSGSLCIAFDEATSAGDFFALLEAFEAGPAPSAIDATYRGPFARTSPYLTHPVFQRYHSEHEMLRYIRRLEAKDLSLTTSMIPLGSCTMKLNATAEMVPVSWGDFAWIHPFAPVAQAAGYRELFERLEGALAQITGLAAVSLQPNAGSQGEYAGMLVIRAYHESRGEGHRRVCLIPTSAHGTNPASAVMAGMRIVPVRCDEQGNIDLADLNSKAETHRKDLAAAMVTYPSTHGVFEEVIREFCSVVHACGGQVYLDGANLNAQVGLCRPGDYGADVCHINLHKTFCIPHGGGGPGMGPIAVAAHLRPFLPGHPVVPTGGERAIPAVSAAPFGSASILPISLAYIAMLGAEGLRRATQVAILNANYMARRLDPHFPILYRGRGGLVAHEFILDCRAIKRSSGVDVVDIAKRLMDFGFHAPTVSFPVADTLMVEPTESESMEELDRLCDAMIAIRGEIAAIERGEMDRDNNPLKNAPHTSHDLAASEWNHPYTREQACFPAPWTRHHKYWPPVKRIDSVLGDRNLVCSCAGMEEYVES